MSDVVLELSVYHSRLITNPNLVEMNMMENQPKMSWPCRAQLTKAIHYKVAQVQGDLS